MKLSRSLLLLLGATSFVAITAYAASLVWVERVFTLDPSAVTGAMAALEQEQDSVFLQVKPLVADVEGEYIRSFLSGFEFAANQFGVPRLLNFSKGDLDSPNGPILGLETIFWKIYRPTSDPLFYSANADFTPQALMFARSTNTTYRFCELNPSDSFCAGVKNGYSSNQEFLGMVLSRRIVSRPEFVDRACPSLVEVVREHTEWTNRLMSLIQSPNVNFDKYFSEADGVLRALESQPWNSSYYKPSLERWQKAIFRRYMDGGPRLMTSYKNCLHQVQEAINQVGVDPIAPDANSNAYIQQWLRFKEMPLVNNPGRSFWIQSKRLTADSIAHLFRRFQPMTPAPGLGDMGIESPDPSLLVLLGRWMSDLDDHFNYRLITQIEAQNTMPDQDICAANIDYLTFGLKNLKIETRDGDDCSLTSAVYIRLPK